MVFEGFASGEELSHWRQSQRGGRCSGNRFNHATASHDSMEPSAPSTTRLSPVIGFLTTSTGQGGLHRRLAWSTH